MRILIAEDDEALARFVRQGLEGERYSVDVYPDGEQARAAGLETDYDVAILDLKPSKNRRRSNSAGTTDQKAFFAGSRAHAAHKS